MRLVPGMIEAAAHGTSGGWIRAIQLEDGGGRSRNRDGQFQPNDGAVVDSQAMTQAYGHPFGKGAVVAAAGGTAAATLLARKLMKRRRA